MQVIHKNSFSNLVALEAPTVELDPNIVLIGDPRWESCFQEFRDCSIFACDLETGGVGKNDALFYKDGFIRLIQVGLPSGKVLICDLGGFNCLDKESRKEMYGAFLSVLKEKLWCDKTIVLGVNFKFDYVFLMYHFGFRTRNVRDLMLTSQVLHAGVGVLSVKGDVDRKDRCQISHGLKGIAQRFGEEVDKTEQVSNWAWDLTNSQLNYAAKDTSVLFSIYEKMKVEIAKTKCKFSCYYENQALPIFAEIEYYGVPVDIEKAKNLKKQYEDKIIEVLKPYREVFRDVNYSSNKDFLEALKTQYPDKYIESTGVDVLGELDLPETNAVLKARTLETSLVFLDGVLNYSWVNKPGELMSIRGMYRQMTLSGTGRGSCTDKINRVKQGMSLQVTPGPVDGSGLPGVRSVISAPPGYKLAVCDLSAAHARIAAELSQSKLLLEIYRYDFDGHAKLASFLCKLAYEEYNRLISSGVTKKSIPDSLLRIMQATEESFWSSEDIKRLKKTNEVAKTFRDIGKTTLYSSLNGSAKGTILRATKAAGFIWFTDELATKAANHFAEMYPELVSYCKNTPKKANKTKYYFEDFEKTNGGYLDEEYGIVVSELTGRHCYFSKSLGRMDWNKDKLEISGYTDCISANWFVVESDVMDYWGHLLQTEFNSNPHWKAYIANQIHDEYLLVVGEEYAKEAITAAIKTQIWAFRKFVKTIPVIEDGPFPAGEREDDEEVFYKWVNTPRGKKNLTPWQECLCQDYSEK
jgi:3'-5' exonuclease